MAKVQEKSLAKNIIGMSTSTAPEFSASTSIILSQTRDGRILCSNKSPLPNGDGTDLSPLMEFVAPFFHIASQKVFCACDFLLAKSTNLIT